MLTNTKEKFLTLSQVSNLISEVVNTNFNGKFFWIVAEITGCNVRKGHCYLSLAEKSPGNVYPDAEIRGIIWSKTYNRIIKQFQSITGTTLQENMKILFRAQVNYDSKFGLSLMVDEIEGSYTIGQLQLEKLAVIHKLKEKGFFHLNKSRTLSLVPQNVAVISAHDSRGFEDFRQKLIENGYRFRFKITMFPSLLQGDRAATEMREQLIRIYGNINDFDVVVIVRGGGGSTNLTAFNDYRLAEAVARFPIPVVTGIGHTANVSVVDEVAFQHCITPTDVADYLITRVADFENRITRTAYSIKHLASLMLKNHHNKFEHCKEKLNFSTRTFFQLHNQKLKNFNLTIPKLALEKIKEEEKSMKSVLQQVKLLDPEKILKRGYSITRVKNKILTDVSGISENDILETTLFNGTINSKVIK
ncbi:MAG: exodeoxyribonuclease VII large subunit [Nitrosopumilus sp.]|nr:exodeoxyribonuclease VII large subunit [Nitrosopumilus sp.]